MTSPSPGPGDSDDDRSIVGGEGGLRLSLFGQKVGIMTPQHNLSQFGIAGNHGFGVRVVDSRDRPCLDPGDPSDVPSPAQRCSTLGILINYRRNVSSQP